MDLLSDVVICEPVRTAVGRYGGALRNMSAAQIAAALVRELVSRTGLEGVDVDDVVLGQCYPSSEAPALGRVAALDAGLPVSVTGVQIDRRCGSGLQAVLTAAFQVASGACDLVLAGGAECMSQAPFYATSIRWGLRSEVLLHDSLSRGRTTAGGRLFPVPGGMVETAERLRSEYAISREEQDMLAVESHRRAARAQSSGLLAEEIAPLLDSGLSEPFVADEHIRPNTTLEALAALKPVMQSSDPSATVTAGNSCGQNDGAALCIVTTRSNAVRLGLRAFGRILSWAVAGVEPGRMGIGPVASTAKALRLAELSLSQIDLIELNEAFASQVLACTREWGFAEADFLRLNVNGSGISLGHPVGATGARILATLLHEMKRRDVRYGLETMCIGGGQGLTAVIEAIR